MTSLITVAGRMVKAERSDDDFADRLSFRYTPAMLVTFAVLVTSKQYVGSVPIECWSPLHFSKTHMKYARDFCWTRNTYYLPFEENIPKEGEEQVRLEESGGRVVPYYQWVALALLIQAFFFHFPYTIWQSFGDNSGIDVGNLIETSQLLTVKQMETSVRERILKKMVRQTDRYLSTYNASAGGRSSIHTCSISFKHMTSQLCCFFIGRHRTNYLVTLYLVVKILYVINVVAQLFLLNAFLGTAFSAYGIDVVRALAGGDDWTGSSRFPRVTMCNMLIRRLGNVHRYALQCVLPINLFNEMIYLFLWFWMLFVMTVTCVTALSWLIRVGGAKDRRRYIRRYLNLAGKVNLLDSKDRHRMVQFSEKYLRQDGAFLIRMMTMASNGLTAMEFTGALWDYYWKTHADEQLTCPNYDEVATLPLSGFRRPGRDESGSQEDMIPMEKMNNNKMKLDSS